MRIFGIKKPSCAAIFRRIARMRSMRSVSAIFSRPYPRSSSKISSFKISFILASSSRAISSSLFLGGLGAACPSSSPWAELALWALAVKFILPSFTSFIIKPILKNRSEIKPRDSVGSPGTRAKTKSIKPTIRSVLYSPSNCVSEPSAKFSSSLLARVMMIAVAVDVMRPGI